MFYFLTFFWQLKVVLTQWINDFQFFFDQKKCQNIIKIKIQKPFLEINLKNKKLPTKLKTSAQLASWNH